MGGGNEEASMSAALRFGMNAGELGEMCRQLSLCDFVRFGDFVCFKKNYLLYSLLVNDIVHFAPCWLLGASYTPLPPMQEAPSGFTSM